MIKNFILIALALVGVAAIVYFGWEWIEPAIQALIDAVKGLIENISGNSAFLRIFF